MSPRAPERVWAIGRGAERSHMLSALFRRQGLRQGLGHFSFSRPLMSTSAGKEGERFKLLFCGRTMADAYHFTRSKLDEKSFDVRPVGPDHSFGCPEQRTNASGSAAHSMLGAACLSLRARAIAPHLGRMGPRGSFVCEAGRRAGGLSPGCELPSFLSQVVWCERADVASEMTDADMLARLRSLHARRPRFCAAACRRRRCASRCSSLRYPS